MANLLIVDSDGRRRARIEIAAAKAGHKCYSAGSAAEALNAAGIYVPDAIILPGDLPDSGIADFLSRLRGLERNLVACTAVIVPESAARALSDPNVVGARADPPGFVAAAADAASRPLARCEPHETTDSG